MGMVYDIVSTKFNETFKYCIQAKPVKIIISSEIYHSSRMCGRVVKRITTGEELRISNRNSTFVPESKIISLKNYNSDLYKFLISTNSNKKNIPLPMIEEAEYLLTQSLNKDNFQTF